jgi:YVTN family beta-propeller protein
MARVLLSGMLDRRIKERLRTVNIATRKRCLFRLRGLYIFWMLLAMPLAASTARVYITNHAGTTISVVDPATNTVVEEIKGIEVPEAVTFSPDGSRVYITQGPENVLTVLDRKTKKEIKKVPLSGHANDLAATKDGKLVLVCIADTPGALDIIDAASLERVKSLPTKEHLHDVVVTPDSRYAVATSPTAHSIIVFDLQSQAVAWDLQFDRETAVPAIESNPDGSAHRIFVELDPMRGFAVVDFAKRQEVTRITFPDDEPTVVPSGRPSHGIGVAPDRKTLWVVSRTYDCVFVYSLPEIRLLGRVHLPELKPPGHDAIGGSPNWVTFAPDSATAYVANAADRSVSAIDMKTLKAVARIPTGEEPGRMNTLVLP